MILSFQQADRESLYEAWERWKKLIRKCPHYGLDIGIQVLAFYNEVNTGTRQLIDTSTGRSTGTKTPQEIYGMIEQIFVNNYTWGSSRS